MIDFRTAFNALTGNDPFPWQQALYEQYFSQGKIPASCNLPTGLGKTSVIAVWLIALANGCDVPRRLVYVVNRRTVVDQTTNEVEKYRENLAKAGITEPLALSTLRGQFADNREWSEDPSRPAVICGTVDMIGSRLLFSGYGCGFKTRPLHAGFLGQDSLIVHDEAHLEPAFQDLLIAIRDEQKDEPVPLGEWTRVKVMELTATSRSGGEPFCLTPADHAHPVVQQRVNSVKKLHLHETKDEKNIAKEIGERALTFASTGKAIIVFVQSVVDVGKVMDSLKAAKQHRQQLTGTLRGYERDELVKDPIFARFLPKSNRPEGVQPQEGTVYLVCTSAGEVGVNISANHLVCDLSTYESMAQRFGRVNRFGENQDTEIHVVHPADADFDEKDERDSRRKLTLALLRELNGDASPAALGKIESVKRQAAFTPTPEIPPTSDILFDAWSLTSIRGKLPGRPPVEPYLHGISEYDPPRTTIVWREEVEILTPEVLRQNKLTAETALELFPIKPHEELSVVTTGKHPVIEQLEKIAAREATKKPEQQLSAWVIDFDGATTIYSLQDLVAKDKQNKPVVQLGGRTVVLPPRAGGLSRGLLDGGAAYSPFAKDGEESTEHELQPSANGETTGVLYDVSCEYFTDTKTKRHRRYRTDDRGANEVAGMRLIRRIEIPAKSDDDESEWWFWFELPKGADDDGSKSVAQQNGVSWEDHTRDVVDNTSRITSALQLKPELQTLFAVAAKLHDLGKQREVWQRSIGNPTPKGPPWYAKSGQNWNPREITEYRHEFGSLIDAKNDADFAKLNEDEQNFVLHIIATHHGRGRPHFDADEVFDPERTTADAEKIASEVPRRFAQLQRKYGRWGLAYLESLLRAGDYAASAKPSEFVKEGK